MTPNESWPMLVKSLPSRQSNPFATCWTRPGALAFRFPEGSSATQLLDQLVGQGWRGEIVGPHGAGKTTLLETLRPLLSESGFDVTTFALHDGQRWVPWESLRRAVSRPRALITIDGYEQLNWFARLWLRWRCRRSKAGLLVTSHRTTGLPPLIRLEPDLDTIRQVVGELTVCRPTYVASADIIASHACHGSNVREVLFDLYERHEDYRRSEAASLPVRTAALAIA